MDVGCDQYREALSAGLDGEPHGVPDDVLAGHLDLCSACREWFAEAARITRLVRVAPAAALPDLAPAVLASLPAFSPAGSPRRRRLFAGARAALVVVAFLQALLAWSGALTGQDDMATGHVAHEVGAWNLALSVAFLMVATRPRAADALVAPVGVFVAVLAVVAASDAAAGDLTLGRLLGHLLVGTGLALLVTIGRTAPPQPGTPDRSRPRGLPGDPEAADSGPGAAPDMVAALNLPANRVAPSVRAGSAVAMRSGSAA
jgi:predicted anti-sigma-YlaC factor YlaD